MNQINRLDFLIDSFLAESNHYKDIIIPDDIKSKKELLRGLLNVRKPSFVNKKILKIQDEYLKHELYNRNIVSINDLKPVYNNIYLWKGDITTLEVDAIVNAANSEMLGCFIPNHGCIDNAIHTYAGIQLRNRCQELMKKQGHAEPMGVATITDAYNLPSKYIIHTVGPIISEELTTQDCALLESCYHSCLKKALENEIESIAFCCISTGEFHFPNDMAAEIAVNTVNTYLKDCEKELKVVFNVFKEIDYEIYNKLLR